MSIELALKWSFYSKKKKLIRGEGKMGRKKEKFREKGRESSVLV